MAMDEKETGNLIGSDRWKGPPCMEPTTAKSVRLNV
jgi:hypothetical protein